MRRGLECLVETDEEAGRGQEAFLGAELDALDLERDGAELGEREDPHPDFAAGALLDLLGEDLRRLVLGIGQRHEADLHVVFVRRRTAGGGRQSEHR